MLTNIYCECYILGASCVWKYCFNTWSFLIDDIKAHFHSDLYNSDNIIILAVFFLILPLVYFTFIGQRTHARNVRAKNAACAAMAS